MPELIDRELTLILLGGVINQFDGNWLQDKLTKNGLLIAKQIVSEQPTVEAEPVRHGRWIELPKAMNVAENPCKCSVCGHCLSFYNYYPRSKFCPNCGTRMDVTNTNVSNKVGDDNG